MPASVHRGSCFDSANLVVAPSGENVVIDMVHGDRTLVWAGTPGEALDLARAITGTAVGASVTVGKRVAREDLRPAVVPISDPLALAAVRIEATPRGYGLCDCDAADSDPTNATTQQAMDHHCGCRAVLTAATIMGAYSRTRHGAQCVHGAEMDEFYQAPEWQAHDDQ